MRISHKDFCFTIKYKTGWRYKKRPGTDFFIDQLKYPLFEVVFVSNETMMVSTKLNNFFKK